jgi:pentatricopeptide repeat protein
LIKKLADLVHEKQSLGKLGKARAVFYSLPADFWELTFTDAKVRQMANYILHELVSLHLPYSLSDKIENLLARFETSAGMENAFIGPYNMLVKSYAQQINVEGALQTLERMKELGNRVSNLLPNERTYNHIVTMYAHRREPEAARAAFEEMVAMGIEPSQASFTSLMNAHVEAGQWEQAISIFEHLDSHPEDHPLKPDASTCTTLIKCYTLMGASTADVLSVYAGMVRRNLKPTPRTFALLLQSACDGGMMDFAEEVFAKMDNMPNAPAFSRKADVEEGGLANQISFTVMIRGFVRAGRQEDAKQYYEEMIKRGIEPSSATWSTLVGAYADARVNDPRAEHIIQNLLSEFLRTYVEDTPQAGDSTAEQIGAVQKLRLRRYKKDKAVARATALHSVYGPVISAYGKVAGAMEEKGILPAPGNDGTALIPAGQRNFDDAQKAALRVLDKFSEMQELPGAKPSIHIYTTLLDAYRRADDLDRVQAIWSALFNLATSTSKDALPIRAAQEWQSQNLGEAAALLPPSQRNLLCLPLSIYIEALSSNHMHNEVVDVWLKVQEAGFGFDAGNWNHLVVALLRAGELDRAFWTVEKILLEPQKQVLRESIQATVTDDVAEGKREAHTAAQAEVVVAEELEKRSEDEIQAQRAKVEPPIRPPNRAHEYRVEDKKQAEAADTVLRLPDAADKSIEAPRPKPSVEQPSFAGDDESESNSTGLDRHQHARALPMDRPSPESTSATTESLTGAFASISARRRKYVWTAYSATLRSMEDSIIRLRRLAEGDEQAGAEITDIRAERHRMAVREQLQTLEDSYPKSWAAIEEFRRRTNRTISRHRN